MAATPGHGETTPGSEVIIVKDAEATEVLQPQPEVVRRMLDRGLTELTREKTPSEAWRRIVSTQDVVGIKVYSAPGRHSGTRAAVVQAVVEGLLAAGLPGSNVVIWDRQAIDLRMAGFMEMARKLGVRAASSQDTGYDPDASYDSSLLGNLVWGDLEFGKEGRSVGRKSYVSKLVTRNVSKIINIAPLLNHNSAGVSGLLYSMASGSVDNFARFDSDRERLSTAVPEIYALPVLCDRVVLNIVDALLCQYEGGERSLLHYSAVLNELRIGRDAVALDALSLQELETQRRQAGAPSLKANRDVPENAALLELGVADTKKIHVVRLRTGPNPDP